VIVRQSVDTLAFYQSTMLSAAGIPHGFSTRLGGVSAQPFDSLNLGNPSGTAVQDDPDRIATNYRLFLSATGMGRRELIRVHQMHGAEVARAERGTNFASGQCADAIITADPARCCSVRTADCVPIFLASDDGKIVAAVHAGWRGIVAGILGRTVDLLWHAIEAADASQLVAAVGPCIGPTAFEVGTDVVDQFERLFGHQVWIERGGEKGHLDLPAAAHLQLIAAGLSESRIDVARLCTVSMPKEFFSHRRDRGITGRMAAVIGVKPDG